MIINTRRNINNNADEKTRTLHRPHVKTDGVDIVNVAEDGGQASFGVEKTIHGNGYQSGKVTVGCGTSTAC